ncbi:MAG TPA: PAS domain-containing sensor histidine kinase [Desulfotomaculum sp.]|nr:PAS domain-containing sensor histidine kinase [Desulfotomaculum sp.]
MKVGEKTRGQLLSEVSKLRRRISQLEKTIINLKKDKGKLQLINRQLQDINESQTDATFLANNNNELQKANEQRAEEKLRNTHQQLLDIIEFLPDATFVVDRKRRVIAWNQAIEEMTGIPKEKIIGRGDYAYSVPFYGQPMPILIDLIFLSNDKIEHQYQKVERIGNRLFAEAYTPYAYNGKGAFLRASASPLYDRQGNLIGAIESIRDTTRRRQAMEELRLSEERFAKAFHGNPVAMAITTFEGKFIDVNKSLLSVTGFNRDELIGRTAIELNAWADFEERSRLLEKVLKEGAIHNEDFKFCKKSGEKRSGLISMELIYIGGERCLLSLFSDISERKQIEEALKRAEREKKVILESINELVIYLDINMQIKWANKAAGSFIGLEPEQLVGTYCYNIFHKRKSPCPRCTFKKTVETGRFQQFEVNTPHGATWSQRFYPVKGDEGSILGVVEVAHDITERKLEMAMYERLNLIGQMAAGIGHEIRNPMTTVRGFLQVLKDKKECYSFQNFFKLMIEELDRANIIITQFLSLAKNKPVEKMMHNLNTIINTISPLIQADAFKLNTNLILKLNEIPDLFLDDKEVRQLIFNLTHNGLEAMSAGGMLTIKTYIEDDEVVLAVQDQGGGIEPDVLEKLGTPFFTTKDNGTGLGLAVCYSIAARHKARIEVETGSHNTTFLVRFRCYHN